MKRVWLLLLVTMLAPIGARAQDQPRDATTPTRAPAAAGRQPPSAAQEGFVPIDQIEKKEEIPAAPLVMAGYAVAWLAVFVYVWSVWQRLGKVEREIAEVTRRVAAGGRQ
jgi:CcmD family protein